MREEGVRREGEREGGRDVRREGGREEGREGNQRCLGEESYNFELKLSC